MSYSAAQSGTLSVRFQSSLMWPKPLAAGASAASWLLDLTVISLLAGTNPKFSGHDPIFRRRAPTINPARAHPPVSVQSSSNSCCVAKPISRSKLLSAMRFQFGGHLENESGQRPSNFNGHGLADSRTTARPFVVGL